MGIPTPAHFIFIPFVLLVGIYIGWILGGRAAEERIAKRAKKLKE